MDTLVFLPTEDGRRIQFIKNGVLLFSMPVGAAREAVIKLSTSIHKAEELRNPMRVAYDQAIMLRSGAPFGFTKNRRILKESENLAQWDTSLRRYMPGGIKSQEQLGTVRVVRSPPPKSKRED